MLSLQVLPIIEESQPLEHIDVYFCQDLSEKFLLKQGTFIKKWYETVEETTVRYRNMRFH